MQRVFCCSGGPGCGNSTGAVIRRAGRFEKHYGYDPALRVPLMMRWPGRISPKLVRDLTEHVDVPATIMDLLEVEPLPLQHGHTLRPYLEGRGLAPRRDHIFSEYLETEQAYLRTERHKFIYCSGSVWTGTGQRSLSRAAGGGCTI